MDIPILIPAVVMAISTIHRPIIVVVGKSNLGIVSDGNHVGIHVIIRGKNLAVMEKYIEDRVGAVHMVIFNLLVPIIIISQEKTGEMLQC